mgnify:CR=1 FL=1
MAPFDAGLPTKLSPLIDGQVPDYIQADHPVFVQFLEAYYKFLESGELTISGTVDQVLLETVSKNYLVLDGTNFAGLNVNDRVVYESGSGTTSKFDNGETIIGDTSKASSTILVEDDERLFISANQRFIVGETVTGQTTGATATVVKYRANPVQNIQQLLDYANPDNTVDHFLTAFRDSFMESIPESLASGVSKRKLIKQIKDLYAAKGTSEGHKLFFRILLNEEAVIDYPSKYMLRMSDGNWNIPTIIRCTLDTSGLDPAEMQGQEIEGASSGTKAQIISVNVFNQSTDSVVEFGLRADSIDGSGFSVSETFTGTDVTADAQMQFTIQGIVTGGTISSAGSLYSVGDNVTLDTNIGNGLAEAKVASITTGSINDLIIEKVGKNYRVGDGLKFTNDSSDTNVNSAKAFVSVTGGRFLTEDDTATTITLEEGTKSSFVHQRLLLNGTAVIGAVAEPYQVLGTDRAYSTTQGYYYPLYLTKERAKAANSVTGLAHVHKFEEFPDLLFYMPDNNKNHAKSTLSSAFDLFKGKGATQDAGFEIILENDTAGRIIQEEEVERLDSYGTSTDGIIIETGNYTADEASEINRVFLISGGDGYTAIPSISVSSVLGTEAEITPVTDDIGGVSSLEITDGGFKYASAPDIKFNTNIIVKDVSGTFGSDNTLTSHTGTVKTYDPNTKRLVVDIEPISSFKLEQDAVSNDRIQLENFDFVPPGRPDHGQINEKYNVFEEQVIRFDLNAYAEEDIQIILESEVGVIQSDAFEIDNEQISLERDLDTEIEFGVRLESGTANPTDEDGRFLLDGHLNRAFRFSERREFPIKLEDAASGTDIFGKQESGDLLFDFSTEDVNFRIDLEDFKFRLQCEDATDTSDVHGTFIGMEDNDTLEQEDGTDGNLNVGDRVVSSSSSGDGHSPGHRGHTILLEDTTENTGDYLRLDGTGLTKEDKVNAEVYTTRQFPDNDSSIILEDTSDFERPNFLVNEEIGNQLVMNAFSTETDIFTNNTVGDGDRILLHDQKPVEDTTISYGISIKHTNSPNSRLLGEGLETFITERSDNIITNKGKVLYNQVFFVADEGSPDGDDRAGELLTEAGEFLVSEGSGINILLDATDSSGGDAGSYVLMEDDDTHSGNIILNGTTSASEDANDDLISEADFSLLDERITDSGGATATVAKQGLAVASMSVGTTAVKEGDYLNTDSLISEDVIRIQDSYFYQAFSYEVSVSAVLTDYINELKRAVHPAGFIPFGKVSLANEISVRMGTTGEGIIDYTGDTLTFTPELASIFGLVFDNEINVKPFVREGPGVLDPTGGSSIFDQIVQENGLAMGDALLEETDGDNLQFENGFDIAIENSPTHSDGAILLDSGVGGKLLAETALGESTKGKRSFTHITKLTVRPEIKTPKTAYGAPLLSGILPGTIFFDVPAFQLEDGSRDKLPIISKDVLVMEGTDVFSTNAGDRILNEENPEEQSGVPLSEISNFSVKDLTELDTIGFIEGRSDDGNYSPVPEGGIVFEQSAASDELVLEDYMHFIMEGGRLNDVLILESGHNLLGEHFDRFRNTKLFQISLEDNLQAFPDGTNELTHIRLETETDSTGHLLGEGIQAGDNSINIVIDGILNRGEKILTEGSKIEFEDETNKGSIPEGNYGNKNITQYTREARVGTNTPTNRLSLQDEYQIDLEIALEDDTGSIIFNGTSAVLDVGGNVLVDATDNIGTDDGDAIILDGNFNRIALNGTDSTLANADGNITLEDGGGYGAGIIEMDTVEDVGENLQFDSTGGRDLGDKVLMQRPIHNVVVGNEGGFFLLDGTDGTSTNAGDEILLESNINTGDGTLQFLMQQTINLANGLSAEDGGLTFEISEQSFSAGDPALVKTFDSDTGTFDSSTTSFDAA